MATKLKTILTRSFMVDETADIPHGLNWQDRPVRPDHIEYSGLFEVVDVDEFRIRIHSTGGVDFSMLLESWHSIERDYPGDPLSPQPFIVHGDPPSPPFPSPEVTITIYARPGGSDVSGIGTLAKPFKTTVRAFRDVPHVIPPGVLYAVDNTGVIETLPPDYQLPVIKNSFNFEIDFFDPDFFIKTGFRLLARPTLATISKVTLAALPPAAMMIAPGDVLSIVGDPDTRLITLTLLAPRASWAGNALAGLYTSGLFPLLDNGVISASTALTLEIAADSFFGLPSAPLRIVDCFAVLTGSNVETSQAVNVADCHSIGIFGQKISGGSPFSLFLVECSEPYLMGNDIAGGLGVGPGSFYGAFGNYIHDGVLLTSNYLTSGYYKNIPSLGPAGTKFFESDGMVWENSVAIGARRNGFEPPAPFFGTSLDVYLQATALRNSIADFDGTPGYGVLAAFGACNMSFVKIDGAAADAVHCAAHGYADLEHVKGAGNGGVGVAVEDGAYCRVRDVATDVTGAGGDMQVGTLPVRTWVNFRGVAPKMNEYDLLSPPVGDEVTGPGTGGTSGSRLYQRP